MKQRSNNMNIQRRLSNRISVMRDSKLLANRRFPEIDNNNLSCKGEGIQFSKVLILPMNFIQTL